ADDAGVVRGAARDDDDAPQVPHVVLVETEAVLHEDAVADAVADRVAEAVGLLVDLLQHERLVAGALGDVLVPVDLVQLELDVRTGAGVDVLDAVGVEVDDHAVARVLNAPRLREERREIRREKVLAVAEPDDEGCLVADGNEALRLVVVDDDEREAPPEARVRSPHGFDQVTVVQRLEQVRDDLGVRLGAEDMARLLELALQLAVVLDDPVEHDRELALVAARQRMRIVLVDRAVRGPARVSETRRRMRAVRPCSALQVLEVADRANVVESLFLEERDSRRVVASKLESLEARDQQALGRATADVSDDPAHWSHSFPNAAGLSRAPSRRAPPG